MTPENKKLFFKAIRELEGYYRAHPQNFPKGRPFTGFNKTQIEAWEAFCDERIKYICYKGGWRSGKTAWLVITAYLVAELFPGTRILITRETAGMLRENVLVECEKWWPSHVVTRWNYHETLNRYKLPNRSVIRLISFDKPTKVKGTEYGLILMDEGSENSESHFKQFKGRLSHPMGPNKMAITTNPEGHDWTWKWFEDQRHISENKRSSYAFIRVSTDENLRNLPPDYIEETFAGLSEAEIGRYRYGRSDTFEGQIFSGFNPEKHCFKSYERFPLSEKNKHSGKPPDDWKRILALDWGYEHYTVALWGALDPDDHLWIYDEYYVKRARPDEIAAVIKERFKEREEQVYLRFIDPSTQAEFGGHTSIKDEFARAGLGFEPSTRKVGSIGMSSKEVAIGRIQRRLAEGTLHIASDKCELLCRQLPGYRRKKNPDGTFSEEVVKKDDDAIDALIYIITNLPAAPNKKEEDRMGWREKRARFYQRRPFMIA